MQKIELEYFKKLINQKYAEVLESVEQMALPEIKSETNISQGESRYTTHLADQGSDTMGKELNSFFTMRTMKFLRQLEEALKRIEDGSYGICIRCGKTIPTERLEEVLHTRHCVPCKTQLN